MVSSKVPLLGRYSASQNVKKFSKDQREIGLFSNNHHRREFLLEMILFSWLQVSVVLA